MRHIIKWLLPITLTACSISADSNTGKGSGSNTYECQVFKVASTLGVHLREEPSLSSRSILVVPYESLVEEGYIYADDPNYSDPIIKYGQVWQYVAATVDGINYYEGWMLERATDGSFRNLVCADGFYDNDAGYDGGHDGGYDGGYDGGHDGGHDGSYDGGYDGGHDGGHDGGYDGGHDGGY